ncbi:MULTISPECIES: actinorhodin polyketide synthase [unclassified Streptomyces]|uniref:actinorhodin polyketide synthase n=1 Tax=unclassified Streptomyces TaxID=2593676 RepID=UPI002E376F73|nr:MULTISPECIES: actinorhodin polyketide synthase [unclassified Streptomyces]WUC69113.1 actinorhodin polyketide synthase [Streptomyces sp. NBC_00539]
MDRLELTDLTRILRFWGGEEEGVELNEDALDLYWVELGYDCLSVLQTTGYIERKFDLLLDGELLELADTPRRYLALVNSVLGARAAV